MFLVYVSPEKYSKIYPEQHISGFAEMSRHVEAESHSSNEPGLGFTQKKVTFIANFTLKHTEGQMFY